MRKYIKIFRIGNWYYYLGFVLLGFFSRWSGAINFLEIFKLILLSFGLLSYAFSFNDFYDLKGKKKYFLFPLFFSLFLLHFLNYFQLLVSLIFIGITTLYSYPKTKLKAKPILVSLCNGIGFSLLFLLGSFSFPLFDSKTFLFFILFFSLNMVAQFIHEAVHYKEDKKNKIITTIVFFGKKVTCKICYFFLFSSIFICFFLYYLTAVNLLFTIAIVFFSCFFIFRLSTVNITISLRKEFRNFGIITGVICLLSFLIY